MQYYSVLQSTTPVLLCTTKYYASTFLCYNVLLRYKVLKSTTPVLLCATKSYSSTTLSYAGTTTYYPVLLQYYASTTKYYSRLQSTTPALLCPTQYFLVILRYYLVTSFTMRGATSGTLQLHQTTAPAPHIESHHWSASHMKRHFQCAEQVKSPSNFTKILRLPRTLNRIIDPHHIWNVISNARSK